ncbi:MAG: hypothetical protein CL910_04695 [Deltaproteobacteria bacterium]|jgi:hypothetical protein|nr:hypothetical protein [Deltaproteobacteria bacterium]
MIWLACVVVASVLGSAAHAGSAEDADPPGAPQPPAEAVVGDLPMLEGYPTRVMVDLAPEGQRPLVMLLDTGASDNMVTPLMARQLGVTVRPAKGTPYRKATRLGRDIQFWVDTASSDTGSKTGWEYGLLGGSFLDDYILELDYPGKRVRFLDSKQFRLPDEVDAPDEVVTKFKRAGTRIIVDVEIDEGKARVMLDTGAPGTLVLSGKAARKADIDVDSLESFGTAGTVLGPMEVRLMEAEKVRWAGFDLGPLPLEVAPKGWYNQAGPSDSVVGYDVLRQFVLRIDYKRKRIWLKRSGDPEPTLFGVQWSLVKELGAFFMPAEPGQFLVWRVRPGSWAAHHGFENGDIVVGSKGLTVTEIRRRVESGEDLEVARDLGGKELELVRIGGGPAQGSEPEVSAEPGS